MSEHSRKISINSLIKYVSSNWKNMDDKVELVSSDEENVKTSYNQNIHPLKSNIPVKITALYNNLDDIVTKIDQNLLRTGVLTFIDELGDIDISIYSSILWILKDGFSNYSRQQQSECIVEFIKTLKYNAMYMFNDFDYKTLGWTEKQLVADIKSGDVGTTIIRFIADYLHINIFILNMHDENMYYSGSHPWVPYKKNILLLRHSNNTFEPVFSDNTKFFTYESKLVSLLIMKPFVVKYMKCNLNTSANINFAEGVEDFNKYITHGTVIDEDSDMINKFDDSTDDNEQDKSLENNLHNMSYSELILEAQKNNISTYVKKGINHVKKSRDILLRELDEFKHKNNKSVDKSSSNKSNSSDTYKSDSDESSCDESSCDESSCDESSSDESNDIPDDVPNYTSFKVQELRDLAKKCGIDIKDTKTKKMKSKTDLIAILDKYYNK